MEVPEAIRLTLVACVAGYFGWQAFVADRHAKAAQWVDEAHALTLRGDHGALVDAERLLRQIGRASCRERVCLVV